MDVITLAIVCRGEVAGDDDEKEEERVWGNSFLGTIICDDMFRNKDKKQEITQKQTISQAWLSSFMSAPINMKAN